MLKLCRKSGNVSDVRTYREISQKDKTKANFEMRETIVLTVNREIFTLKRQKENCFQVSDLVKILCVETSKGRYGIFTYNNLTANIDNIFFGTSLLMWVSMLSAFMVLLFGWISFSGRGLFIIGGVDMMSFVFTLLFSFVFFFCIRATIFVFKNKSWLKSDEI